MGQFVGNCTYLLKFTNTNLIKNIGASETTCETLLTNNLTNNIIDDKFKHWLIGFTEGDGSFIVSNRGYCEFKLTQSSIDSQVLYKIKNELGLGHVAVQDKNNSTHHLRIRDKVGNKKIIDIFNGNLHTEAKIKQFKYFLNCYNKAYGTNIEYIENNKPVTLNNGWLSGFTDAESCFNAYISKENLNKKNRSVQIRYILSQKGDKILMDNIANLLGGSVSHLKAYNGYNMTVNLTKLKPIIEYFNEYTLLTKKTISYNIWLKMYYITINKEHITSSTTDGTIDLNKLLALKEELTKANKIK